MSSSCSSTVFDRSCAPTQRQPPTLFRRLSFFFFAHAESYWSACWCDSACAALQLHLYLNHPRSFHDSSKYTSATQTMSGSKTAEANGRSMESRVGRSKQRKLPCSITHLQNTRLSCMQQCANAAGLGPHSRYKGHSWHICACWQALQDPTRLK